MTTGAARKGFDGDLLDGTAREDAFARLLLDGRELWEHKRDFKCAETGNLAIEFQTSSLPNGEGDRWWSGISVCEAFWWVVEFAPERRLVVPVTDMKMFTKRAISAGLTVWGGDDKRFHNALVPFMWLDPSQPHL